LTQAALRLALGFAGAERILAGSDYLPQLGSLDRMRASIAALGLPPADKAKVLRGNARRLLSSEEPAALAGEGSAW
jgi:predicted TIM-barrel fold metal-dependent hydrolase